jgi:hypothetical protein
VTLNRRVVAAVAGTFVALNLVLLRLACDSDEATPRPRASGGTPTSTLEAGPEHPSGNIRFSGDAGLTGRVTDPGIRCNFPALEGLSIALLVELPDSASVARVGVRSDAVSVVVSSGSGPDYRERAFEGSGVTSFAAASGARFESTLTETVASPGSTKGDLGTLTGIQGSIECGDQTAGSSTVTITGDTAEGRLSGAALDPVRVECDASPGGNEVFASGLVQVGEATALVAIGLASDGTVSVDEMLPSGRHRYLATGSSTITSTGATVRADALEQDATPAHTLHVEGELTCGVLAAG